MKQTKEIPAQVTYNGFTTQQIHYETVKGSKVSFAGIAKILPSWFKNFIKDYRLYRPELLTKHQFVIGGVNIVCTGYSTILPDFSKRDPESIFVCLLDEPPSLGHNFQTRFFFRLAEKRLAKELTRFDKIWVYHSATEDYVKELGVNTTILKFPCILDYTPIKQASVRTPPKRPYKLVVASSFLPWHGILNLIEDLRPFLTDNLVELTLLGDGPDKETAVARCHDLINVHFIPKCDFQEYQRILERHDFGVLWQIPWFNSPLKIMDYARAQLTIVSEEAKGVQAILPKNSFFTPKEFIEALREHQNLPSKMIEKKKYLDRFLIDFWNEQDIRNHLKKLAK